MKWKLGKAGALRARWRYRPDTLDMLWRRGACLQRQLMHASAAGASRRACAMR